MIKNHTTLSFLIDLDGTALIPVIFYLLPWSCFPVKTMGFLQLRIIIYKLLSPQVCNYK